MRKIAIIGASGQVGAEVTPLLHNHSKYTLIPICRNPSSSAFLRYYGTACRHGIITDPKNAKVLLGDCDIIANFALSKTIPRKARVLNSKIIEHSIRYSAKNAKIIYFSTMSVYGEPKPDTFFNRPNAYAREKLHGERLAKRFARSYGKEVFILRLGHVCGELQNITDMIQKTIKAGPVKMPNDGQNQSNTVYTATIVEAIINITSGLEKPGIYDLMCVPQWTWREVYEYEASRIGQTLQVKHIEAPKEKNLTNLIKDLPKRSLSKIVNGNVFKESTLKVLSRMPETLNMRIKGIYSKAKAKAEISTLLCEQMSHPAFSWEPIGKNFLTSLSETKDLLQKDNLFKLAERDASIEFPDDIAYYTG